MSFASFVSKYVKLPEANLQKVLKKTSYFMLLFFLPIGQFYAALYAIPLFAFPFINSTSQYMGYTFAYFYPKSLLTVLLFVIYYLVLFYFIERWNMQYTKRKKSNINNGESTF